MHGSVVSQFEIDRRELARSGSGCSQTYVWFEKLFRPSARPIEVTRSIGFRERPKCEADFPFRKLLRTATLGQLPPIDFKLKHYPWRVQLA